MFSRKKEPIRYTVLMEIYCEDLAHKIVEAKKSHDPLSTSWRHRKASDAFWCEPEGLRTREAHGRNPRRRGGKMSHLKQAGRKQRSEFLLPVHFVLSRPSMDWMMSLGFG